jgi:protein SCO1/2
MLLIGEPLAMLALLGFVWPRARRIALGAAASAIVAGSAAATLKVRAAQGTPFDPGAAPAAVPLDRAPPPFALLDQLGDTVRLERFRGQTLIVAFAYAHCTTVCPIVVQEAKTAHRALPGTSLVIITLDPWRDTPSRLRSMADAWQLEAGEHVLSGPVDVVNGVIRAWQYPAVRDTTTGEVTHATYVHVVAPDGRLWQVQGRADAIMKTAGAALVAARQSRTAQGRPPQAR